MDEDTFKKEKLPETSEPVNPKETGESLGVDQEPQKELENPELVSKEELKKKIEEMHLDPNLAQQSKTHANDISSLPEKEKLETLLKSAKEKGVIYAINVAKNMNNPYLLDTFHDLLAKEGYYKEFKV